MSGLFVWIDFVFSLYMHEISFISLSEKALLLSFGSSIDFNTHTQLMMAKQAIESNPFPGFVETVPAYNSLAVYYRPEEIIKTGTTIAASVTDQIKNILATVDTQRTFASHSTKHIIPVCYDEEFGIDLAELSEQLQLTKEKIIQLHTSSTYKVFMTGFTPGFAYMGILNEQLLTKRKAKPRSSVAEGSVAVAGNQTGIYPMSTPGGWNIIGRTPLKIFNKLNENPFLLKAGDEVQFVSITKEEYQTLSVVTNPDSGLML